MPLWKRGRNTATRNTIDSQPASCIYRYPATIASLWSEGPTDQLIYFIFTVQCVKVILNSARTLVTVISLLLSLIEHKQNNG